MKLFRPGKYPVVRGSTLMLDDKQAFLWTAGYVPRLDTYLNPETPTPYSSGFSAASVLLKQSYGT